MRDPEIFYLRICFMLLMSARFLIAHIVPIIDPNKTFAHSASMLALFVKQPNQDDLIQYVSTKQIFLGLHHDEETFSFYESDAPYTFFTFGREYVDFELLYAETMKFSVKEGRDIWHFRCVFPTDKSTLDIMFPYLSDHTGTGSTSYRMNIIKVESYAKIEHMSDPIIEAVDDLQQARLYDRDFQNDNFRCLKKIYTITQSTVDDTERPKPRLVFRSGNFQISQVKDRVVLKLATCPNWYYIFYFRNTQQSRRFANYLSLAPLEPLDLPDDLQLYVETRHPYGLKTSVAGSETDSDSSRKRSDEGSSVQLDSGNEQPKRRRSRTKFTEDQLNRLRQELNRNSHPREPRRQELADELGLKETQVKDWFRNERHRTKDE